MSTFPHPLPAPTCADRPALFVGGLRVTCLLNAEETAGAYSLFEILVPPHDPGPPPHTHTLEDESFFVLEGEHTVVIDGQEMRGGPGTWMFAPRHKPHVFRNDTDQPTRVLMIASPGGFEKFFDQCSIRADEPGCRTSVPSEEEIARILDAMPRFGMTPHLPT